MQNAEEDGFPPNRGCYELSESVIEWINIEKSCLPWLKI